MSDRATRVRVGGPLGPYSDGFRTELAARGYEPSSAAGQLQGMAHLSRWLVDRGLDRSSPWCGDGWVLTWGFGLSTDYMPRRWVTPRSSKACRCSGVGVVSMVNAGMSSAG